MANRDDPTPRRIIVPKKLPRDDPIQVRPAGGGLVAAPALVIKQRPAYKRNYGLRPRTVTQFVVIHCTDGHEGPTKDDDVAAQFAGPLTRPRSCTYVIDTDSVTQCLDELAVAWHCGHTGNARSIGIEFCGRARQSADEWLDDLSRPMLELGARLVREVCDRHHLPIQFVNAHGLRRGDRGVTTHAEVTRAWGESTHTDPGPNFPMGPLLTAAIRAAD
jgi:N-acetyl-anhydromuramyl-L-alanine amidase AmpD